MKYFSMFSGIGGFELGILYALRSTKKYEHEKTTSKSHRKRRMESNKATRLACIGYSEIDKYAIQIYEKHFKGHKNYGNARRIIPEEIQDFDFLCGGFPCQAFSIAGKRGGFKDTRGTLFYEIARIVSAKRPKLLLLENVKGLLSHDNGRTFGTILATLSKLGYICEWQVLNSKNFGVPQNRERVFIVGYLRETSRPEVFPVKEIYEPVGSRIRRTHHNDTFRRYNQTYDIAGSVESLDTSGGGGHQPCIPSGSKIRQLTPTECERLQGFPDGWTKGISDSQRYKCLGNAVTVNVVEAIMEKLF